MKKPTWIIPEPISTLVLHMDDGAPVTVRQHGYTGGPRLVFNHGVGLAIDQYYPLWSLFCGSFEVVVYDLRYHGLNSLHDIPDQGMPVLVNDQQVIHREIQTRFGEKPTIGIFHSISALVSLLSPTGCAEFVKRILLEPLAFTSKNSYLEFVKILENGARMAAKRIQWFPSKEDYIDLLQNTPRFDLLTPAAIDLMARTTLRPSHGGKGYELCCPREFEAQIVEECTTNASISKFVEMSCPTLVIGADIDTHLQHFLFPPIEPHSIPGADYNYIPGTTHFLPLEKPEDCATMIFDYIGSGSDLNMDL